MGSETRPYLKLEINRIRLTTPKFFIYKHPIPRIMNSNTDTNIFKSNGGLPLLLYMSESDPLRSKYIPLIEQYGGIIVRSTPTPDNGIIFLSSTNTREYSPAYSTKFVDDSIAKGAMVDISRYKWEAAQPPRHGTNNLEIYMKLKKSSKYTPAQDEFILEQIRMNPVERGSHKFFATLAEQPELQGHSQHSIRSRYRKHLADKLLYCYKLDDKGRFITNKNGEKIKFSLEEIPDRKKKFTAEDDYILCLSVLNYTKERSKENSNQMLIPESPSVPISFFKDVMRRYKNHTDQSWRDRYRKFAVKYGIKSYVDYYENAKKNNIEPEPMKDFTSNSYLGIDLANKRRRINTSGNLLGSLYQDDKVNVPLDEEISEIKNSNIDEVLHNQSHTKKIPTPVVKPPVLKDLGAVEEDEIEDDDDNDVFHSPKEDQTDTEQIDQGKNLFQSLKKVQEEPSSPNVPSPNNQLMIESSQSIFFSQQDPTEVTKKTSRKKSTKTEAKSKKPKTKTNSKSKKSVNANMAEAADLVSYIRFVEPGSSIEQLIGDDFFGLNVEQVFNLLEVLYEEIRNQPPTAAFAAFEKIGWKPPLIGHIIKTTGGNLQKMQEYNKIWITKLALSAMDNFNIYDILAVEGIEGLWTEKTDSMLKGEVYFKQSHKELDCQSPEQKAQRFEFLKRIGEET